MESASLDSKRSKQGNRVTNRTTVIYGSLLVCAVLFGCNKEEHAHPPGTLGGFIVSVGRNHYHAEVVLLQGGGIKIFMLGNDESKVMEVEKQTLSVFVRPARELKSTPIELTPEPQAGDTEGKTSLFVGELPSGFVYSQMLIAVPNIQINGERYRFNFVTPISEHEPLMPAKVTELAENELYLEPGGKYTEKDIEANGAVTASTKFESFVSNHNIHPKSGDSLCPVTNTKANPECSWIIGGKEYFFCCPPCIDEYLKMAKEQPEKVKTPSAFVMP